MTAAPQSIQPEITLVQDLQMDADMLKDGYQKNLTELWHSDVVREAAKNALRAADRIEELTKALEQIRIVAVDNSATTVRHDLALEFVGGIAARALAPSLEDRP